MIAKREKTLTCVSIIIPSFNSALYIRQCVESVLAQTLLAIEVICVDAKSTDGTQEILEQYAAHDKRLRIIHSEKKSYGYQVNLGIQAAQGEYIAIVETDDYIDSAMYESLYSNVMEDQHPDFIKSGFYVFACLEQENIYWSDDFWDVLETRGAVINLNEQRHLGVQDINHIWSAIYRRDFLLEKGIQLHESPGASYQDLSFSMLVGLLADTAIFLRDRYYFYRIDNKNSSVRSADKWRCVIEEFQYTKEELSRRNKYSQEIEQLVWRQKPEIFYWNALRLPTKERGKFLAEIQQELKVLSSDSGIFMYLSEDQRLKVKRLMDEKQLTIYIENSQKKREHTFQEFLNLIALINEGKQFVMIGAGKYGQELIFLQKALRKTYIKAVADNDMERQCGVWNDYILLSVQEAVRCYKTDFFLIATKRYKEIQRQITNLGISRDRIFLLHNMLSRYEMLEILEM